MSGNYGDVDVGIEFDDNPLTEYIDLRKNEGTSPSNLNLLEQRLLSNSEGTAYSQYLDREGLDPLEMSLSDMYRYRDYLREQGHNDSGIVKAFRTVSTFYNQLMEFNIADGNPAGLALKRMEIEERSPDRIHVTVEEMAEFVKYIQDPQDRAVALFFLKTAVRRGECANVDLRCLNLDDDRYREDYLEHHDIRLHDKIRDRPDSVYIYSEINQQDEVAGEERVDGNKRKRETVIPIDTELKRALLEYLSIRPRTTAPYPLFVTKAFVDGGKFGRYQGYAMYNNLIDKYGQDFGLTNEGYDRTDLDIHFFRHFFTTQMQENRGDHDRGLTPTLVKYIRGDVLDDKVLSIYSHDSWGVNVREAYLDNIYTFGLYE